MPCPFGLASARVPAVKWRTRVELLVLVEQARASIEASVASPDLLAMPATADLARQCGLSQSRFIQVFRKVYGLPPRAYRSRLRVAKAAEFQEKKSLTVTEAAAEAGYSSASAYCRRRRALQNRQDFAI